MVKEVTGASEVSSVNGSSLLGSAKTAFRRLSSNQFLMLTIVVVSLGFAARLWSLTAFSGFSANEVVWLSQADKLIRGHYALSSVTGLAPLFVYILALLKTLAGGSVLYIRLGLVISGLLASVFFYLFANTWFNKQVSLVAALFFSTNATLCIMSRTVQPVMLVLALQFGIIYLLTIAFRDKNKALFLLSGLVAAAGIFLNQIFIFSGIIVALVSVAATIAKPKIFELYKYEIAIFLAPVLLSFAAYGYLFRSSLIGIFSIYNPGSLASFYLGLGRGLLTLFFGAQFSSLSNVGFEPLLDPLVAITAICGIVLAVFHFSKRKHKFFLFWLLGTLILYSLVPVASLDYLVLAIPILLVFAALSVDYLLTSWVRTFPYDRSARLLMTTVFSIFLFLSVYYNFQKFFYGWLGNKDTASQYTQHLK